MQKRLMARMCGRRSNGLDPVFYDDGLAPSPLCKIMLLCGEPPEMKKEDETVSRLALINRAEMLRAALPGEPVFLLPSFFLSSFFLLPSFVCSPPQPPLLAPTPTRNDTPCTSTPSPAVAGLPHLPTSLMRIVDSLSEPSLFRGSVVGVACRAWGRRGGPSDVPAARRQAVCDRLRDLHFPNKKSN